MATNHLNLYLKRTDEGQNDSGRYSSEPVNLNSILCEYFGFEVLKDLFQSNKKFLHKLCDRMPSSNDEYMWVWRKSTSFSEEEHRSRMEFFVEIWNDECYRHPVGPSYAYKKYEEYLVKEAPELRKNFYKLFTNEVSVFF